VKRPPRFGVDDGREHGRRVEVGQRKPVDRAVAGDERHRPAVAQDGVVAHRCEAVDVPDPRSFLDPARTATARLERLFPRRSGIDATARQVSRRDLLGGLIHEYELTAA
jgi:hypothetical protein